MHLLRMSTREGGKCKERVLEENNRTSTDSAFDLCFPRARSGTINTLQNDRIQWQTPDSPSSKEGQREAANARKKPRMRGKKALSQSNPHTCDIREGSKQRVSTPFRVVMLFCFVALFFFLLGGSFFDWTCTRYVRRVAKKHTLFSLNRSSTDQCSDEGETRSAHPKPSFFCRKRHDSEELNLRRSPPLPARRCASPPKRRAFRSQYRQGTAPPPQRHPPPPRQ